MKKRKQSTGLSKRRKDQNRFSQFTPNQQSFLEGKNIRDLHIYILLFLLTLVFYGDLIFSNKMLNAMDILTQVQYFKAFSRKSLIENTHIPLWYPDIYSGMPAISALFNFYPFSLLFLLFPVNPGINLFTAFHTFLAGFFIYLYMKEVGLSKYGALISSITFMFSAYFISRAVYCGHEIKISTIVWIPLVFLFFNKGLKTKKVAWFVFAGAAMGLELIAGHMQIIFYTGIALVVYALFGFYWMKKDRVPLGISNPVYIGFTAMAVVFLMASAVQFIPAYEYANLSSRGEGTSYAFATSWSLPPEEIFTYLLPGLKGLKLSGYFGRMPMSQATPYLGVLPLVLAGIAIIFKRDRYVAFFLTLCGLSIFIALGKYNPFYRFIYDYIPGFNLFRVPQMILVLAAISLAALAGIGSDTIFEAGREKLLSPNVKKYVYFLFILAIALMIIVSIFYAGSNSISDYFRNFLTKGGQPVNKDLVYKRYMAILLEAFLLVLFLSATATLILLKVKDKLDPRIIKCALIVILLIDLWYIDYKFMETLPVNNITRQGGGVIDFLRKDKDYFRVLPAGDLPAYPANKWSYFGFQSIAGYHAAPLASYSNYMDKLTLNNRLPDLLNAKYVILAKPLPPHILNNKASEFGKYELVYNGEVKVYKNNNALPRAFIAKNYRIVSDDKSVLDSLASNSFPLRDTVLLNEKPAFSKESGREGAKQDAVKILKYTSNEIILQVETRSEGILVLNEVYYPGWKAYVDGKETSVMKANYLLRAIPLKTGSYQIVFSFKPMTIKTGALLSILAFFVIVPFSLWWLRKETKREELDV